MALMVWYVAVVAILNLALGYALAVYLGAGRKVRASVTSELGDVFAPPEPDGASLEEPIVVETNPVLTVSDQRPADDAGIAAVETAAPRTVSGENIDRATGLQTREHIEKQLAKLALADADQQPVSVALVEVVPAVQSPEGVEDRLLRGVAETARELLADRQTAGRYSDHQFLLLLARDDLQHATKRAEELRQRVAATQFIADGQPLEATVTCALAQVSADHTATNLLEFLEETLQEAKRYGGNRTFMHDGTSPTPVVPPELNVSPQTCAI
jgi:PleD family two-component response regulator